MESTTDSFRPLLLPVDDVMCHFIFDVLLILREGLQFVEQSIIVIKLHGSHVTEDVCFDLLSNFTLKTVNFKQR